MNTGTFVGLVILLIFLIVVTPFLTIWSINTLFNLGIDYTVWTWLAMAWLSTVTFGGVMSSISKKKD